MKSITTNTVPIPSSVFKPAFSIISPSENFALTVYFQRYKSFIKHRDSIIASRSLGAVPGWSAKPSSFASNV